MRAGVLVPLLGLAGTLAAIASSRRRTSAPPDTSRCTWTVPNPIPIDIVRRAQEIQALGAPLGTEYVEELGGRIYKTAPSGQSRVRLLLAADWETKPWRLEGWPAWAWIAPSRTTPSRARSRG